MSDANTRIQEMVEKNKVLLFMKGNKAIPQCGFSSRVVAVLKSEGVPFETVNVLDRPGDPGGHQAVLELADDSRSSTSNGKFVGGCDIVTEMHQSGELAKELVAAGVK